MPLISAIFLLCSLALSLMLGAQTRSWSWGPALIMLLLSVIAAVPAFWQNKSRASRSDWGLLSLGLLIVSWIGWRAFTSPVRELASADLMLLAGAVGAFLATRALCLRENAANVFTWGLATIFIANLVVFGIQMVDPSFSPIYAQRPALMPSGFFGHYNDGANFLIGASFLLAGPACFGKHGKLSRTLLLLLSVAGLVAVYFSRSRGGILAVAIGILAFVVFSLIFGKRQKAKWFAPLAVVLPILIILGIGLLLKGWAETQELRFSKGVSTVMDNPIRLYLLGIALSCISLHPLVGGGSRSYSWECYRFWDYQSHGGTTDRPEMVHNELVQAATDYGLIGVTLIGILLLAVFLIPLVRTFSSKKSGSFTSLDAWQAGAFAALIGMLCQSSFSFVFHLLPGVILLGICLAMATTPNEPSTSATGNDPISAGLLTTAGLSCIFLLFPSSITATRICSILIPSYVKFSGAITDSERISQLTNALAVHPQASLYKERALIFQRISIQSQAEIPNEEAKEAAISDYQNAILLHPYEALYTINLANLLSAAGRDQEAAQAYEKTIELQGGMELGYRGLSFYAEHLLKKGTSQFAANQITESMESFSKAVSQLEAISVKAPWELSNKEGVRLKLRIYEGLGLAREASASGNEKGAIEAFEEMTKIDASSGGDYYVAAVQAKLAKNYWTQRRSAEALTLFLRAKERMDKNSQLPPNISLESKIQLRDYIDQSIIFLQKARITPSPMSD